MSTACKSHVNVSGLISSLTFPGGVSLMQHIGRSCPSLGSQFECHTSVSSPVPILRIKPCLSTSLPSTIARQTLDGEGPRSASRNKLLGKYTALRTLALSESGSCRIRHACRASSARLKISMSRKPMPPMYFGLAISSHATQHVFLLPSLLPHQKLRSRLSMCWHSPRGSLKHDIEKVGIACATDLIRTSFPPDERVCSSQP